MADFTVTELNADLDFSALPYCGVVSIGAGPAGLTARLPTAHRGLTTLVIEAKDQPGGRPQCLKADKGSDDVHGSQSGITRDELCCVCYARRKSRWSSTG